MFSSETSVRSAIWNFYVFYVIFLWSWRETCGLFLKVGKLMIVFVYLFIDAETDPNRA